MSEIIPDEVQTLFQWEHFRNCLDAESTVRWFAAWTRLNRDFVKISTNELYASVTTVCKKEYVDFRTSLADRTNNGEKLPLCIPPLMQGYANQGILPDDIAPIQGEHEQSIPIFGTEDRVPLIVGGIPRMGVKCFEGEGVNAVFNFKNNRGLSIDASLFNSGWSSIPAELSSPKLDAFALELCQETVRGIIGNGYEEYSIANKSTIDSFHGKTPLYLWVVLRFREKTPNHTKQLLSHVALRTDGGCFNLVQCSYKELNTEWDAISLSDFLGFAEHWHSFVQKKLSTLSNK